MTHIDPQKITDAQLKTQKQRPQTKAEALRTQLKILETRIAQLSETPPDEVLEIPSLFDQLDQTLGELQELGMNTASELGQIETLSSQFKKKRALFIRRIGGPQVLVKARKTIQPSRDRLWWYADQTLASENRQNVIRWLRIIGIIAAILIVLGLVYQNFFAPDPTMQASYGHQQRAENAVIGGDFEDALAEVQQAITLTPDNPRLYVMLGVIQEGLGLSEAARSSFDTALQKYDQDDQFYYQRTTLYIMLGDAERALADSETAIQLNPDSAISYMSKGHAYEMLGDIQKAIESLEKADEIAQQSGDAQLQAIIRISLSMVYQKITVPTLDEAGLGESE